MRTAISCIVARRVGEVVVRQSNRGSEVSSSSEGAPPAYGPTARAFHWIVTAGVLILIPLGITMTARLEAKLDGPLTDAMYSTHKTLGFTVLLLMIARLVWRFAKGAPADLPSHSLVQRLASHTVHWLLYALLVLVPLGGWIGVSYYGALDVFGLVSLPRITPVDQDVASLVLTVHKIGGWLVLALVALHVAAALFHHLILRDGVIYRIIGRPKPPSPGE